MFKNKFSLFQEFLDSGGDTSKGIGLYFGGSRIAEKLSDIAKGRKVSKRDLIDALKNDADSVQLGLELFGPTNKTASVASNFGDAYDIIEDVYQAVDPQSSSSSSRQFVAPKPINYESPLRNLDPSHPVSIQLGTQYDTRIPIAVDRPRPQITIPHDAITSSSIITSDIPTSRPVSQPVSQPTTRLSFGDFLM